MSAGADHISARAIELLGRLVAFDSVSHRSNLPLIRFIEDYLALHHVEYKLIPSADGMKSNLFARIGAPAEGGIILSGHTDVVPVEGQSWDSDPFTVMEKDGKLYGRGTCDMKSFLAVCLAMVPEFKKTPLAKPVYLAFSYDEEVGCIGVPDMVDYIVQHVPRPAFALIGEPTMMQVVTAHKGVLSFETTVHGLEWHSSQPHYGVNAIHYASRIVGFLAGMNAQLKQDGLQDGRFDPPHSTAHVGVIEGGTARNIIPKQCRLNWEIRPLPGEDTAKLLADFDAFCNGLKAEMKQTCADADIVTVPKSRMMAVTLPDHADAQCRLVQQCAQSNRQFAVSFGTEAGVFGAGGIPAIVCGPGNIEQAHKPNEFIETAQIGKCVEFMLKLVDSRQ